MTASVPVEASTSVSVSAPAAPSPCTSSAPQSSEPAPAVAKLPSAPGTTAGTKAESAVLEPLPLTPELMQKGFGPCNPPDPLGLGPYRPYLPLTQGRLAMPQKGGATEDFGYDVLIHFHGSDAIRKTVVQVARGIALVAIDKGNGSGPYEEAFRNPAVFDLLRQSIEGALKRESGDPRAHIRHLGLSAWSAGYGAVLGILAHRMEAVDAVVLLDGLHASWLPGTSPFQHKEVTSIQGAGLTPIVNFSRLALEGKKLFVLTHSHVDPVAYPSVALTASWLLHTLGLERSPTEPIPNEALPRKSTVDQAGFHVWEFGGHNEMTHCSHISLIARAVRDIVEPAWQTPAMDRSVPPTPGPLRGITQARTGHKDSPTPASTPLPRTPGLVLEEVGSP